MQHVDGDQGRLTCRCCGEKTDSDAYCMRCSHYYDKACSFQRHGSNCIYCGFMLDIDGTCMKDKSHGQVTAG